jgi:GNAT superfamily N-acetyltransferase
MAGFQVFAADTRPAADLCAAFNGAFSDYVTGPVHIPPELWDSLNARQGVVDALGRVAVRDGAVIAFGFVCPRPETNRWRLGAMGAVPAARGTGAAQALLDDFLARAKEAGMAEVELECFAANERALRLYRSRGFEAVGPLNAWKATGAPVPAPTRDVRAVDRASAFAWLAAANRRVANLPFQNTDRSLAEQARPLTFWQCDDALMVFSVVEGTPTTIHALIDLDPSLRAAEALALALRAAHPDAIAPPLLPDALGGAALGRAGFEQQALGQVFMRRVL